MLFSKLKLDTGWPDLALLCWFSSYNSEVLNTRSFLPAENAFKLANLDLLSYLCATLLNSKTYIQIFYATTIVQDGLFMFIFLRQ